jgi:YVTN family beta-propeller protein
MKTRNNLSLYLRYLTLFIIAVFLTLSCLSYKSREGGLDARVSVILEMVSEDGKDISLTIGEVALRKRGQETAVTFPLQERFMLKGAPKQVLLGDFSVQPGRYTRLTLSIPEAFLFHDGSLIPIHVRDERMIIDIDMDMGPWDRKTLPVKMVCGIEEDENKKVLALKSFVKQGRERVGLRGLKAYVTDEAGNSVLIFDRFTGAALGVVAVGERPRGIVISPDGRRVYIANSGSDSISVLDTLTAEVIDTIFLGLGVGPEGMAITADGKYLITANKGSNNISLIDLDSQRIIEHIPVGRSPLRVALSPWGDWAYVTNNRSNELMIVGLNERQVVSTINTRPGPVGVASSPGGDAVFVSCRESNVIQEVDTDLKKVINVLPTNIGPMDVIFDGKRGRLYVANSLSNDVCVLVESMNMKETTIPVGDSPNALALDDSRRLLYVVNQGEGTVSVIDLGKQRVVDTIKVGNRPWGIVIDRFGID